MTSDATLEFSSCPDNTPTLGLHQFQGTQGLDLFGVFYIATPPWIIESALALYSYPGFFNIYTNIFIGIYSLYVLYLFNFINIL